VTGTLTEEWCAGVTAGLDGLPDGPGGSGVVELVVSGGDPSRVVTHWVVEDGRLVAVTPAGDSPHEPQVSVPLARKDLDAVLGGDLDPAVAFMRGDLKPDGSPAAFLAWLSSLTRDDTRAALVSA
jgi:hypothetical protein